MSRFRRALWALGSPVRAVLLVPLWAYHRAVGPALGARCRFHPSCSVYAAEAIRTRGALRGVSLAAWRVARCSPLSAGGLDPVPRTSRPEMNDAVIHRGEAAA